MKEGVLCIAAIILLAASVGLADSWKELDVPLQPTARSGHSLTAVDGALYLFGGQEDGSGARNDLYRWAGMAIGWSSVSPEGQPPAARTNHATAAYDGLLYVADLAGFVYCFDPKNGKLFWKYDTFAAIWGSPFYVDGKIYIGDEDGDVAVLKAGKGKDGKTELLHEVNMGAAVYTTPVVKDGVMYIVSRNKLFALENGIEPKKAEPEKAPKAKG